MKYDSLTYWSNRTNPNANPVLEYEKKMIPEFLEGGGMVLDFGCGIGRTFPLYPNDVKVVGVDFTDTYREQALKKAHFEFVHIVHNIHREKLPFENKAFDKAIAVKVLLHAPDEECKRIIKELGRVAKQVMITSVYDINKKRLASHCFHHEYVEMIESLGFKIVNKKHEYNQIIITYEA